MSELTLQGGSDAITGSFDPKLLLVAIKLKCFAATVVDAIMGTLPALDGVSGLIELQPRTFSLLPAGLTAGFSVEATLEGAQAEGGLEYGGDGTTSNDPIESHPDFLRLQDLYGGGVEPDSSTGKMVFPKTLSDDAGGQDFRNELFGTEDYLVPGATWTRKYTATEIPGGLWNSLGCIEAPPGPLPSVGSGRNWLKVRARPTFRGNIWLIEETWMLSGPYGWNADVYRAR